MMVFLYASPPNGAPCVLQQRSYEVLSALRAPLPMIHLPMMRVGRLSSFFAASNASRIC